MLFRSSDKITLTYYEYNINKYFTPLLDVTRKLPVWSDYTFPESTTVAKKIRVSALLVSIVIGICVDIEFLLDWFNFPCTVATDLGKYLLTSFDVNPGDD